MDRDRSRAMSVGSPFDAEAPIDVGAHLQWPSGAEVMGYLPVEWQDYVGRPGSLPGGWGARPIHLDSSYQAPGAPKAIRPPGTIGESEKPLGGTTLMLQEAGIYLAAEPNPYLAREIARAANNWFLESFLDGRADDVFGAAVVAAQLPDEAAAEITRLGTERRIAAVLLGSASLGRPFGHPVYQPIFDAAAEFDLPVVLHADGDAVLESVARPSAAGRPATYAELRILSAQSLMTHLASLIANGSFERRPGLKVLLHGGTMTWLAPLLWRLDANYKALRREVPWLKRLPSEYAREHVRVSTYPIDTTLESEKLAATIALHPDFREMLCFASGTERDDAVAPEQVSRLLPDGWEHDVMRGNAAALLRL
jgi:predicted TIM-barrel fold metal-dependent hydrolase